MLGDWQRLARCQELDPDTLFVEGAEQQMAKRVCIGCPVRLECLAEALDNRIEFGVWGGMTERDRRALLRQHPQVSSWREAIRSAQQQAEDGGTSNDSPGRKAAIPPTVTKRRGRAGVR